MENSIIYLYLSLLLRPRRILTVYDRVYHTPGDNILGFGILSPGVVYRGGVVYTVPPVIKWVVVWDFRLFTTAGGIP